jgi:hypothetical protein
MCCLRRFVARFALTIAALLGISLESVPAAEEITNSIGMKLVLIPEGEFLMEAEEDRSDTLNDFPYCDPEWLDGELPQHKVRITKPFAEPPAAQVPHFPAAQRQQRLAAGASPRTMDNHPPQPRYHRHL